MHCVNKIIRFHVLSPDLSNFEIRKIPKMYILKMPNYTIIVFENGKGRIMGKKASKKTLLARFPNATNIRVQSKTYSINMNTPINLEKIRDGIYEPELFASRTIHKFEVMINLFHNGKVIVMGKKCNKCLLLTKVIPYIKRCIV